MSSPLNTTSPPVTVYPGRPMITFDRVDLPEPFGPIRACVSPCFTIRSIPLRISLPSTSAWRSTISSVAAPFVLSSFFGTSIRMSSPSVLTGKTSTGSVAGSVVGFPLFRSNVEPCFGHSIVCSSTSTSPSSRK